MPPPSVRLQQCCCKTIQRCCNVATRCVRAHLPACMPARTRTHAALVQIAGGCASRVQRLDAIVATLTGTHLLMSTAHSGTYMSARTVAHTVYSLSRASLPVVPFGRRLRVNLVAIIAVCFPIVLSDCDRVCRGDAHRDRACLHRTTAAAAPQAGWSVRSLGGSSTRSPLGRWSVVLVSCCIIRMTVRGLCERMVTPTDCDQSTYRKVHFHKRDRDHRPPCGVALRRHQGGTA